MKRIKILFRKNLKMTPGKIAAQCVHAALGLPSESTSPFMSVVVLGVSDKKFQEAQEVDGLRCIVRDAGYSEVAPGTETCLALIEEDTGARLGVAASPEANKP